MSRRSIDLTGKIFGRLTVIKREENDRFGGSMWLCECECGKRKILSGGELRRGNVSSCGCLSAELASKRLYKHGFSRDKIYSDWSRMKRRCYGESQYNKRRYSERGITVCDKWRNDFQSFYDDVSCLPNFGEPGYSLDRIDNDGNYEPGNVRWADSVTQANNRQNNVMLTYNGETHSKAEWARKLDIPYSRLQWRLLNGWSIEEALTK